MFEDSTFASTGRICMRSRSGFVAAFILDAAIVIASVMAPLMYPHMLPHKFVDFLVNVPAPAVEQPKPQSQAAPTRPVQAVLNLGIQAPRTIPVLIYYPDKPEPPISMSDAAELNTGMPDGAPFASAKPVAVTKPPEPHTLRVPSSIVEGLLFRKTIPDYPPIARATRTQGTVVLQATISEDGAIANLRVASGSPMLQQAALSAVSTWRYRPYLLNGRPIAVETTINVVFRLDP